MMFVNRHSRWLNQTLAAHSPATIDKESANARGGEHAHFISENIARLDNEKKRLLMILLRSFCYTFRIKKLSPRNVEKAIRD